MCLCWFLDHNCSFMTLPGSTPFLGGAGMSWRLSKVMGSVPRGSPWRSELRALRGARLQPLPPPEPSVVLRAPPPPQQRRGDPGHCVHRGSHRRPCPQPDAREWKRRLRRWPHHLFLPSEVHSECRLFDIFLTQTFY